ncbi:MAG: fasciclin domain-containing protein [Bacteroidales bacterium]
MKSLKYIIAALICAVVMNNQAQAMGEKTIVEIAVGSKDHTTLVAALKAADLVTTLSSKGPFTVFAPTNAAFDKIPADALANLLKPENKATLSGILTYHVVAGNIDAATLTGLIKKSKGVAVVKTVNGQELKASIENGKVILTDAKGGKATVIVADLKASNGVIHVTDAVSMPK